MATSKTRITTTYRDFRLSVYRGPVSGLWCGMAKGLGTVILCRHNYPDPDGVIADIHARLDQAFARQGGVFAGK